MKKKVNNLLNLIKGNKLEAISFGILLLWAISPVVEYIFKNYYYGYYTKYFSSIIYFIGISGIILYIIYFIKLKKKKKINFGQFIPEMCLIVLIVISTISSILSNNQYLSFFGETYRKEGLFVYIMYIGFILLSSIIKNNKYILYIFQSMIIACLIITIIPLFNDNFTYTHFTNIFKNTNHYGYYLMINTMLALLMFMKSNKIYKQVMYGLIYVFFLYLLILNNTFGSYLAIFITLLFLFVYSIIKKHNQAKIILVIGLFILTSFVVSNYNIKIGESINFANKSGIVSKNVLTFKNDIKKFTSNNENDKNSAGSSRGVLWIEGWKYTLKHPFFGGGMECLKYYYIADKNKFYCTYSDRPHNSIIQVSAFIGIPGLIVYLSLIIYIALSNLLIMKKDTLQIMLFCSAMCYFISSLFGNSMYYTSPYFMILLGLLIGFIRRNKMG